MTRFHRCSFGDLSEAASFVAALSRLASGPAGAPYREPTSEFLVCAGRSSGTEAPPIYLSDSALQATMEGFGAPAIIEVVDAARLPADCEILYGAGALAAWGVEDAQRRLTTKVT